MIFAKLGYLKIAFSLLPILKDAILLVEDILPGVGRGEEKLIFVRELIEDAIEMDLPNFDLSKIWPILERWITKIVKMFNDNGWPNEEITKQ